VATTLEYAVYRFGGYRGVIAVSKRVAEDLVSHYRCPAPIHVIYHGVDVDLFSPENRRSWRSSLRAQYGFPEEEMVFLYVGDLRKGADQCIRALASLERGSLLFVSRSPVSGYLRLAEELGVAGRVTFLGPTNQVEKVYAAADAFLLPTPYDAFAMVVSEAMAFGLPVVVSRHAGAAELIQRGENGLLLEDPRSVEELTRHMRYLADDRGGAAELGCAARKTVGSMSWDSVARQTMRVYEEVLRNPN
jgi:UDP-glucose:(heptosyl)LPS alpha-1,3-glucosyltransferase